MKFKVGDKVLMNPDSRFCGQEEDSDFGIITNANNAIISYYKYEVNWMKNGIKLIGYSYNDRDLLPLVKEKQFEFVF
jgi:hypothetical protein